MGGLKLLFTCLDRFCKHRVTTGCSSVEEKAADILFHRRLLHGEIIVADDARSA